MHTKGPKEDPLVDMGYEIRDIDYKALKKAVIAFFIFTIAMFGSGAVIYRLMNPAFDEAYQKQKLNLRIPGKPNPLLQDNVSNITDIMSIRKAETARLTSTGWADEAHTHVHIPVERAIDLLVERGLPQVGANVPAVSKGNTTDQKKDPVPAQAIPAAPTAAAPSVKTR